MLIAIFFIFTILLFKNYYKWTTIILSLCPLFMQFSLWEQNLFTYLIFVINILFFCKLKSGFQKLKEFPLTIPLALMAISLLVTNFNVISINRHTPRMISELCFYFSLYIFWCIWKDKPIETTATFIKTSIIFSSILAIYCIFEGITGSNPFIDLMNELGFYNDVKSYTEVRNGIKRVQGFYSIYTTVAGLSLNFICMALLVLEKKLFDRNRLILIIILLFTMAFFTGMRSGIVSLCICLLMFVSHKNLKPKIIIPVFLIIMIAVILYDDFFYSFYESIIHTDKVQGSTEEMRDTQLKISILAFQKSPLFGNGINYTFTDLNKLFPELAGADSIWMSLMIDQGLLGILGYVAFFIACFIFCYKNNSRLIFYTAGVLCSQTIASVTSFPIYYVFPYILIMNEILNANGKHSVYLKY